MRQKSNDSMSELLDEFITENLGEFIIDSIERMIEYSDMTPFQQLCVIDGAIALGVWTNCPRQMEELRAIRSEFIQEHDYD